MMTLNEAIKEYENIAKYHTDPFSNGKRHYTNKIIAENFSQLVEWLKELKQLREQSHWIPISKRLPELREPVLTFDGKCICVERRIEWIDTPEGQLDGEWWIDGYDGDEYDPIGLRDGTAIAWMPLPIPFEPQESEVEKYGDKNNKPS